MSAFRDPIDWERSLPIRPSTPAWVATVRAAYGTPLEPDELDVFLALSGGRFPPEGGTDELLAVVGRRGGKSETIARLAVYEALHGGHSAALAPGQVGVIPVIAPLRKQASEILNYVVGLSRLPAIARQVESVTADTVTFKTHVAIQVGTCDSIAVVGSTFVGAIAEEFARWPSDDSVTPDRAIIESLRPGLAPVVGAPRRRFFAITSAYLKEGVAFETDRDGYGKADASTLVVRGTTETFNPSIDRAWLAKEQAKNARAYAREYLAEWQDAVVDGYFASVLFRAIDIGRKQSNPRPGVQYVIALDPAWKSDQFAMAVAHREQRPGLGALTVIDGVHAWKPPKGGVLSTVEVIADVRRVALAYGTSVVYSDQASAPILAEECTRQLLALIEIPWLGGTSENSKSTRFRRVHAAMADGLVRLPDDQPTVREFANVASRLLRSGAEQIEARSGHDDRVSAVVLACTKAADLYPAQPWDATDVTGGGGGNNVPRSLGNGGWGNGVDLNS